MADAMLELRGLSKRFPGFTLEPLDLTLPGGTLMGLMGANGAGKTTLLKLLMGLIRPDAGQIRFQGRDLVADGSQLRQRIAYVADEPRFVLELPLQALKDQHARFYRDWDDRRWLQLMAEFGLDPRARARELSLGMRTKFALTLALAREAELLILDEPTTGLDPVFRRSLLQSLATRIQDEGRSILFSTHITSDLDQRVDRIALLQSGRLRFDLDPIQLPERWALVKGGLDLLDAGTRASFAGLRCSPHGFEALMADSAEARRRFQAVALVEAASLEDILVLLGKGEAHGD